MDSKMDSTRGLNAVHPGLSERVVGFHLWSVVRVGQGCTFRRVSLLWYKTLVDIEMCKHIVSVDHRKRSASEP